MNDIEILMKSEEYLSAKKIYDTTYFKLFGHYCFLTHDECIEEKTVNEMIEHFRNKKISCENIIETTNNKGVTTSIKKMLSQTFFNIWREDEKIPEYNKITFECDISKMHKTEYNLFNGFKHFDNRKKPKKTVNLETIMNHIFHLCGESNTKQNEVLNYFAQLVQTPHILPDSALIFISSEGTGKDLFGEFLEKVIGEKYFNITEKLSLVAGDFNSMLGGKLLTIINEANPIESTARIENIKSMITAKTLQIMKKYKDPVKTKNFCRFVFFSNRLFAFPVEDGARRANIMQSSEKYLPKNYGKKESAAYFKNLAENHIHNKDVQHAFLKMLLKRDLSDYNPRVITKSDLHQQLEDCSSDPLYGFMAQYLDNINKNTFRIEAQLLLGAYRLYLQDNGFKYEMSAKKFNLSIENTFGIKSTKNSVKIFLMDVIELKKMLRKDKNYKFKTDEINNSKYNFTTAEIETKQTLEIKYKKSEDKYKELEEKYEKLLLQMKPKEDVIFDEELLIEEVIIKPKKIINNIVKDKKIKKTKVIKPVDIEEQKIIKKTKKQLTNEEQIIFNNKHNVGKRIEYEETNSEYGEDLEDLMEEL